MISMIHKNRDIMIVQQFINSTSPVRQRQIFPQFDAQLGTFEENSNETIQ